MRSEISSPRRLAVTMVQVVPADGLPTAESTAETEAWAAFQSTQLVDVRKAAENWRNGLVAMLGAVVAFSLIKGPSDISDLDAPTGHAVGVVLLLAVVSATAGAWWSLAAAYGWPREITRATFFNEGGIEGYRFIQAKKAAKDLFNARAATIVTLTLLVLAVAITWYAPRTPSVLLSAGRKDQPDLCGKMASLTNGYLDLKPSNSAPVRLLLPDVIKLSVVQKCP